MDALLPPARLDEGGSALERNQARAAQEATAIGHNSVLDIDSSPTEVRRTGIVCTVGPQTSDVETLTAFRQAGMEVMRLNFCFGGPEFHAQAVLNLRESCRLSPGPPVAIAVDLQGPAIRTGQFKDTVHFEKGDLVNIHTNPHWADKGTKYDFFCDYPDLPKSVHEGSRIYVDDGKLMFEVIVVLERVVQAQCVYGGTLSDYRGVSLPGSKVQLSAITPKDKMDIEWAVEHDVDFIFVSQVQCSADIVTVRNLLGEKGREIRIVAKIENHRGVTNVASIIAEADGVMVGRGDLGTELPIEKVFVAQKLVAAQCSLAGRPCMCASQLLNSMCYNPRPTRAEVSDVANAVLDGFDSVMLSAETVVGQYPVQAVQMLSKIIFEAEAACLYQPAFQEISLLCRNQNDPSETIALSATQVAYNEQAGVIIVLTASGNMARLVSKYRPRCPVICVTTRALVSRRVQLCRGVYPLVYTYPMKDNLQDEVDARILFAMYHAIKAGYLRVGDVAVATQGAADQPGATNTVRVMVVPPIAATDPVLPLAEPAE